MLRNIMFVQRTTDNSVPLSLITVRQYKITLFRGNKGQLPYSSSDSSGIYSELRMEVLIARIKRSYHTLALIHQA